MEAYRTRAANIMRRIDELAAISEDAAGVTRRFGTPAFLRGAALVKSWFEAAGLSTRIDSIGNVRGRLVSLHTDAKTFVIASHIDTVVNAGRFDGPLGVLLGLDLLEQIAAQQVEVPFHIELIAFSDEEGVRFHTTYLGSEVVTGAFNQRLLQKIDAAGITLAEVLTTMGGNADGIPQDAIPAADWLGYFEAHIEQGPVLWERNIPVALVTAIAGQQRIELTFKGMAGHAGTVPMTMRQDALCCAAEVVLAIEQFGRDNHQELVATVGKLDIRHAASNVIPGEVVCSLDLRSADAFRLMLAAQQVQARVQAIADQRNIALEWNVVQQTAPVACDASLNRLLTQAIADANYEVVSLVSGAGHDAVPVSKVAPATMLFIRCFKGISHNPLENVESEDLAAALQVVERFFELTIKDEERHAERS